MSPATAKTWMTIVSGVLGAAAFVPQLAPYQMALGSLASFLMGGAFVPRPGDLAQAKAATAALAAAIKAEK